MCLLVSWETFESISTNNAEISTYMSAGILSYICIPFSNIYLGRLEECFLHRPLFVRLILQGFIRSGIFSSKEGEKDN